MNDISPTGEILGWPYWPWGILKFNVVTNVGMDPGKCRGFWHSTMVRILTKTFCVRIPLIRPFSPALGRHIDQFIRKTLECIWVENRIVSSWLQFLIRILAQFVRHSDSSMSISVSNNYYSVVSISINSQSN